MQKKAVPSQINSPSELVADPVPVSFDEALAIFNQLADREDIAFGYPHDGCYARAHLMCEAVSAMGLEAKKCWAFEGKDRLSVKFPTASMRAGGFTSALLCPS